MGLLIPLEPRRQRGQRRRVGPQTKSADIIFFTGVRYMRSPAENIPNEPTDQGSGPRKRRKRA